MSFERSWWFRAVLLALTLATVWWLTALIGIWPYGARSISSWLIALLCLMGAERLYSVLLGILAAAILPKKAL
ncbi:MAG TPA: hypothetical protein VLV25_04085 [Steroidobacteraceae bacterium]|nr:hypothetical protein [Steroidobacteraceae bacterium]